MPICEHNRTEILARRDGEEYVRCLDCDQVFEAGDLEPVPAFEDDDSPAPVFSVNHRKKAAML